MYTYTTYITLIKYTLYNNGEKRYKVNSDGVWTCSDANNQVVLCALMSLFVLDIDVLD